MSVLTSLADKITTRSYRKERGIHPECIGDFAGWCRGKTARHDKCRFCPNVTCERRLWVSPKTLRREFVPCCSRCRPALQARSAKRARTNKDWKEITVPVRESAVIPNVMAEQYPSEARAAVRAFEVSGVEFATVPSLAPDELNNLIVTLGLQENMYAEQRDHTTVIRRIDGDKK